MEEITELTIRILKLSDHTPNYKLELETFIEALEQDKFDEYLPNEKSIWFRIKTDVSSLLHKDAQDRNKLINELKDLQKSISNYSKATKKSLEQVSERLKKYFDNKNLGLTKTQKQIINYLETKLKLELPIHIYNDVLINAQKDVFAEEFPDLALYIKFYNEVLNVEQRKKINELYGECLQDKNEKKLNLTKYIGTIYSLLSPEQQVQFGSEEYYKDLVQFRRILEKNRENVYVDVSLVENGLWKSTLGYLVDNITGQKRVAVTLKESLIPWRQLLATAASGSSASSSSSSSSSTHPEGAGRFTQRILYDGDSVPDKRKRKPPEQANAHLRSSSDDGATSSDDDKGQKSQHCQPNPAAVLVPASGSSAERPPEVAVGQHIDQTAASPNQSGNNDAAALNSTGLSSSGSSASSAVASTASSADLGTALPAAPTPGEKRPRDGTDGPNSSMTPGRSRDSLFQLRQRVQAIQQANADSERTIAEKRKSNAESALNNQQKRERLQQEEEKLQKQMEVLERRQQELQQEEHKEDDRSKQIAEETQALDEGLEIIASIRAPSLS